MMDRRRPVRWRVVGDVIAAEVMRAAARLALKTGKKLMAGAALCEARVRRAADCPPAGRGAGDEN